MTVLLLASIIAAHSPGATSALRICKPAIARKAEGDVADISVVRSTLRAGTRTLRGNVTIFVGMGQRHQAPPARIISFALNMISAAAFAPDASGRSR